MPYLPEGQLTQERRYEQAELSAACLTKKILWARAYLFDAARRLHFHLGFCEGIMPFEESALDAAAGNVRDIAVIGRVGRMTCFTVKEITANENDEPIAILSRAEAQQRCKDEYFDLLEPGDIMVTVNNGHIGMYLGHDVVDRAWKGTGFEDDVADADVGEGSLNDSSPRVRSYWFDGDARRYEAFRNVKKESDSEYKNLTPPSSEPGTGPDRHTTPAG